ncbi:MAG TPA: c-type cytochrome [Myxococcales bacterium]|nr:c-type cytochrome [Myxococcales bacterium]
MKVLLPVLLLLATSAFAEGRPRPLTEQDAKAGRAVFQRECAACHGERGDGNGPGAAFVDPKPRNFTKKLFKLRTTASGEAPATADILRTIERGIPGSAMPSFSFLSEQERRQVAAVVLDFADLLDQPEPAPIKEPGAPPAPGPQSVAKGKQVYEAQGCAACHGTGGKGDGPAAKTLADDDGNAIKVRDFTTGVYRGGADRRDLYYRFTTGLDGTPMPAFADSINDADRWALVDYIKSLEVKPPPQPLPRDAIAAGRAVAAKYSCRACHVLDDGKGGSAGPDLRISGQKLDSDWVRGFVQAPREKGKIYPWRTARMPHLGVTAEEADAVARYLAAMGKREVGPAGKPPPGSFVQAKVDAGQLLFMVRCTECHNLGHVVETPLIKQQGPDLINVAGRVDYGWARKWILDPQKVYPGTKMTVPGLTPEEVDAVRMFVWKTSMEAQGKLAAK